MAEKKKKKKKKPTAGLFRLPDGRPTLRDSFTAYVDELGTKSKSARTNAIDLRVRFDQLEFVEKWIRVRPEERGVITFSDNIALGEIATDDNDVNAGVVTSIVHDLAAYQLILACDGRFVRGGVCRGLLYMDTQRVYGPALVEAVSMEEHLADAPRILVAAPLVKVLKNEVASYSDERESQGNLLLVDQDGRIFINYLEAHEGLLPEWLKDHKERVEAAMFENRHNPKILAKYEWVAKYHNWYVADSFSPIPSALQVESLSTSTTPMPPLGATPISWASI